MARRGTWWSFIFLFLLAVMFADGSQKVTNKFESHWNEIKSQENRMIKALIELAKVGEIVYHEKPERFLSRPENNGGDDKKTKGNGDDDPKVSLIDMVSFLMKDLTVGKQMPIYFPNRDLSTSPPYLSSEEANSILFSSSLLPHLLQMYSILKDSPQDRGIPYILEQCNLPPLKEEKKFCALSLESMFGFVHDTLGWKTKPQLLRTERYRNSEDTSHSQQFLRQNYTIMERPVAVPVPSLVACHSLPFPAKVFYCHQMNKSSVFKVTLMGENGDRVKAITVCHTDMSHNRASFLVPGIKPGIDPVCHWLPQYDLVWVPSID
ncbi:BURP domain protein USPL1-like [Aristolochia californica]|uniref:BURP domain protein USPL1-like n=1 Tax=Aristolochia californica TaxID=171875 RepID=UPI0035DC9ADD